MKIGVLGAGVSGLSFARLVGDKFDVEILERNSIHGGIARTKNSNGVAYHVVGGHCFNSKYPEVMDFVFETVLPKDKWHNVQRDAVIKMQGNEVSYPIEYAIQQIFTFDPQLAMNITTDFLGASDDYDYKNLEDWFRKKFGDTLADIYFIPYNTKIWNRPPVEMSPAWVEGKLPIPDKKSFFKGLISNESDMMPHSSFFYPDTNNQNTFIDSLAEGLSIVYNYQVTDLTYNNNSNKWIINKEREYDIVVSTLPLNIAPTLITNAPENILAEAKKLKYNKVTTMLWETQPTERTWTYVPESGNFFHRYIHIGNFFSPKGNYSITEVVGEKTYDEMVENGKKDPFLIRPIDYNVSDHAYVVFDDNYEGSTVRIKNYLTENKVYPLGRFGEWQYYNMDVCIKSSMDLVKKITDTYS
ncbi:protoporphyrinogen/coproporphyrinogen oxidase [Mucilaginibacter sp. HD30]